MYAPMIKLNRISMTFRDHRKIQFSFGTRENSRDAFRMTSQIPAKPERKNSAGNDVLCWSTAKSISRPNKEGCADEGTYSAVSATVRAPGNATQINAKKNKEI